MKKELIFATILIVLHSLEEIIAYFLSPNPIGLPFLKVYVLGQIVLFSFLAFALWKVKAAFPKIIVGLILLYEIVHLMTTWRMATYTPGIVTAVLIIIFAIPYWFKLYNNVYVKNI